MAVPSVMSDLSTTAASNSPAGSESPTAGDDFIRAISAILRATNAKGADIASASTTDIGAATGEFVDVTGTTTITALGTIAAGIRRTVRFTGALTLTHNATSLILPGSANITTANGDVAEFRSLGSGNWKCVDYLPQSGAAIGAFVDTNPIVIGSADATKKVRFEVDGLTTATTRVMTPPDKDITLAGLADINGGANLGSKVQSVTATQASGALTLTTNPTVMDFRSTTLTSGAPNTRTLSSASSLVVPSGATLGVATTLSGRLVKGLLDNAGTLEEFVVNLAGGNNLDETTLINTTAISASSTAANVIYSTTARTGVPFRVTGFVDAVNTAGAWSNPTLVQGIGGQALAALASLGYGQTWQNVLGSRAFGTTYTNTTGKPIQLSVYATATVGGVISYSINGVIQGQSSQSGGAGYGLGTLTPIVPQGATYLVTNVTSATLVYWFELR